MKSATLDSNVFRKIASPESFPKDELFPVYRAIADSIQHGGLKASICETMLNIEAIEKVARVGFYSTYEPKFENTIVSSDPTSVHGRVSIGPDLDAHPGVSESLRRHLEDGFKMGIRIRHAPRIGLPRVAGMPAEYFEKVAHSDFNRKYELFCEAANYIESEGWGLAHLKAIAAPIERPRPWFRALALIDETARKQVPKAVAEWADGDAVASHIGGGADYFCTLDFGRKAGPKSVFSPDNRRKLSCKYGTEFVTPPELLKRITDE